MRYRKIGALACAAALASSAVLAGTANAQIEDEPETITDAVLDHPATLTAERNADGDIEVTINNSSDDTITQCSGLVFGVEAMPLVKAALPDINAGNDETEAAIAAGTAIKNSPVFGMALLLSNGSNGIPPVLPQQERRLTTFFSGGIGDEIGTEIGTEEGTRFVDDGTTAPGAMVYCAAETWPEGVTTWEDYWNLSDEQRETVSETSRLIVELSDPSDDGGPTGPGNGGTDNPGNGGIDNPSAPGQITALLGSLGSLDFLGSLD